MRIRLGTPLAVAVLALLGAGSAQAGLGGVSNYGCCSQPSCDSQVSFSSCNDASRPSYTLVYDTVNEKRFHVVHQTVIETVMKPVTRTCYRDEIGRPTRRSRNGLQDRSRNGLQAVLRDGHEGMPHHRLQEGLRNALGKALRNHLQAGLRNPLQGLLLHLLQASAGNLLQAMPATRCASPCAKRT